MKAEEPQINQEAIEDDVEHQDIIGAEQSPEQELQTEQQELEAEQQEVHSLRVRLKTSIGKLLKLGYGAMMVVGLLTGVFDKAQAQEYVNDEIDKKDRTEQVDEPIISDPPKGGDQNVEEFLIVEDDDKDDSNITEGKLEESENQKNKRLEKALEVGAVELINEPFSDKEQEILSELNKNSNSFFELAYKFDQGTEFINLTPEELGELGKLQLNGDEFQLTYFNNGPNGTIATRFYDRFGKLFDEYQKDEGAIPLNLDIEGDELNIGKVAPAEKEGGVTEAEVEQPEQRQEFNTQDLKGRLEQTANIDISDVNELRGPKQAIEKDGKIFFGLDRDEVNQETEKIRQNYNNSAISSQEAILKYLEVVKNNPDHKEAPVSLRRISSICEEQGQWSLGKESSLQLINNYGKFQEEFSQKMDIGSLFKFANLEARENLESGDAPEAIKIYQEIQGKTTNPKIVEQCNYHIKALESLPKNYSELNSVERGLEETIAYTLNNPEFQATSTQYEEQEEFIEKFVQSIRSHIKLGELHANAEQLYGVELPEGEPVIKLEQLKLGTAGEYINNENQFMEAATDTVKVMRSYFEKHARASYQEGHTNIPPELLEDLKEDLERTINVVLAHEKFHDWGHFKTTGRYNQEHFTEGLTDLLARNMYRSEKEISVGYSEEAANWGNLAYILAHEEGKDPKESFDDGVKFLAQCFLKEHDIKPVIDKLDEILGDNEAKNKIINELLIYNNNPYNKGKILHEGKTDKMVELADELGINLEENFTNLRQLGLSEYDCYVSQGVPPKVASERVEK